MNIKDINYMSCNIALITGCHGMDARTLTHFLLSKNYKVILTYRRNSYFDEENIKSNFKEDLEKYPLSELHCEVCDISCQNSVNECIKSVIKQHGRIDEFYHLAAMSHVGNSFKQKELSIIVNGQSYYYILECLKNISPKTKFYGAMSSELIGGVIGDTSFNEDTIWNPKSPYAIGKALAGHWIKFYRESIDTNMFCCFGILSNHSNTYRSLDFFIRKVTNSAAKIACGKLKELYLGNLNFYRDEHWSDFGCEMMWKMLQHPTPDDYVIGTGLTHHGEDYLYKAFNYFNLDWRKYVKFDESLIRPNEVVKLKADSSKAQKILGWNPDRMKFKHHIDLMCEYDFGLESGHPIKRPNVFELFP